MVKGEIGEYFIKYSYLAQMFPLGLMAEADAKKYVKEKTGATLWKKTKDKGTSQVDLN